MIQILKELNPMHNFISYSLKNDFNIILTFLSVSRPFDRFVKFLF